MNWSKWDNHDFAGLMPGLGQSEQTPPGVNAQGDMRPLWQQTP